MPKRTLTFCIAPTPLTDDTATRDGSVLGTPLYMAPEQILGEESGAVIDVYAFACVAYELLSGKKLFEARSMAQLLQDKLAMSLPPARDIGPGITLEMHGLLIAALHKDPGKRLSSLRELEVWADVPERGFLKTLFTR